MDTFELALQDRKIKSTGYMVMFSGEYGRIFNLHKRRLKAEIDNKIWSMPVEIF